MGLGYRFLDASLGAAGLTSLRQMLKRAAIYILGKYGYAIVRKSRALIEDCELDYFLDRYLAENRPDDFFFIQVGAHDGIVDDPISGYIRRYGWRGILLEPQRDAFLLLQKNYRDQPQLRLLNAALAAQEGVQDLYRVKNVEGLPVWGGQIASFKLEQVLKHEFAIPNINNLVEVERVQCLTFNTLLDETGESKVDLLQIDAEGLDYELIKTIDFARFKPRVLHYEHRHLSARDRDECIFYLFGNGYGIAVGRWDTTAVPLHHAYQQLPAFLIRCLVRAVN